MKFVEVKYPETDLLKRFLKQAGKSLESFRYFQTRELSCLQNHVYTTLLINDAEEPVAYGHLDNENNITWLGIAVAESATGSGLGKQMMKQLVAKAREKKVARIRLSVDNTNTAAIGLYNTIGFKLVEKKGAISFYEYEIHN